MLSEHENRAAESLARAEMRVAETMGELMELWGFRRQLGRIWAVLFLSPEPMAAPALCQRLQISTGLLSMSLTELRRWGVVRSIYLPNDRKEHFEAETNVWQLIRRVLEDREKMAVENALASFEAAMAELKAAITDPQLRPLVRFRLKRIEQLHSLAKVGLTLLRRLVDTARVDIGPLRALSNLLGRSVLS